MSKQKTKPEKMLRAERDSLHLRLKAAVENLLDVYVDAGDPSVIPIWKRGRKDADIKQMWREMYLANLRLHDE